MANAILKRLIKTGAGCLTLCATFSLFASEAGGLVAYTSSETLAELPEAGAGGGVVFPTDVTLTLDPGTGKASVVYPSRLVGGTLVKSGARQTLTLAGVTELTGLRVEGGVVEIGRTPVAVPKPVLSRDFNTSLPYGFTAVEKTEPDGRLTRGVQSGGTAPYRGLDNGKLAEHLAADGSFTLSLRLGAIGATGTFFMLGDGSDGRTLRLRHDDGKLLVVAANVTNDFGLAAVSTDLARANWHQLTVVYDAVAKRFSYYRDSLATGAVDATFRLNPQNVVFGAGGLSSSTGAISANKKNCQIDDLRLYDVALSAEQVAEVVRQVRVPSEGPVLSPTSIVEVAEGAVLRVLAGNVQVAALRGKGWVEVMDGASFVADDLSRFSGSLDDVGTNLVIRADADWIPMEPFKDVIPGSALDFSRLAPLDAPAGKHGRVVVRGNHFEFADLPGVPQRFFGAQISDTATVNVREAEADKLAEQLVRRGYNAVRLHHHDKVLVTSSDPSGTTLNTYALKRFDYLVHACVSRGLYVTTDLYASRSALGLTSDDFKYLVMVDETVKQNFKDFARNFLTHVNPYTGRSLAKEPALIGLSVVNESQKSLFATPQKLIAAHPTWGEKWAEWIARKKKSSGVWAKVSDEPPSGTYAGVGETGYAFMCFIAETERAFAREMKAFIRDELGCTAPLTALNGASDSKACFEVARGEYDYVDWHGYVDHPTFLEERWKLPATLSNKNTLRFGGRGVIERAWMRLADRPVTATEWQYAAPGQYRAAGGLLMGAYAATQAYDGIWRFAYAESVGAATNAYKKTIGFFESTGDPLSLASERAAVCLYRRGDLPENTREYLNQINPLLLNKPQEGVVKSINSSEGTQWAAWYAKIGSVLSTNAFTHGEISAGVWPDPSANKKNTVMTHLGLKSVNGDLPVAANGHVTVRNGSGYFAVNTDNTSGGFAESGTIDGGALTAKLMGGPAAVWASTLDGKGFTRSHRILVTHLTDAVNSGIRFADTTRTTLLDWGALPLLMRDGQAEITLRLSDDRYCVYALSRDGSRRRKVPFVQNHETLSFTADVAADPTSATCLYEVVVRPRPLIVQIQ